MYLPFPPRLPPSFTLQIRIPGLRPFFYLEEKSSFFVLVLTVLWRRASRWKKSIRFHRPTRSFLRSKAAFVSDTIDRVRITHPFPYTTSKGESWCYSIPCFLLFMGVSWPHRCDGSSFPVRCLDALAQTFFSSPNHCHGPGIQFQYIVTDRLEYLVDKDFTIRCHPSGPFVSDLLSSSLWSPESSQFPTRLWLPSRVPRATEDICCISSKFFNSPSVLARVVLVPSVRGSIDQISSLY